VGVGAPHGSHGRQVQARHVPQRRRPQEGEAGGGRGAGRGAAVPRVPQEPRREPGRARRRRLRRVHALAGGQPRRPDVAQVRGVRVPPQLPPPDAGGFPSAACARARAAGAPASAERDALPAAPRPGGDARGPPPGGRRRRRLRFRLGRLGVRRGAVGVPAAAAPPAAGAGGAAAPATVLLPDGAAHGALARFRRARARGGGIPGAEAGPDPADAVQRAAPRRRRDAHAQEAVPHQVHRRAEAADAGAVGAARVAAAEARRGHRRRVVPRHRRRQGRLQGLDAQQQAQLPGRAQRPPQRLLARRRRRVAPNPSRRRRRRRCCRTVIQPVQDHPSPSRPHLVPDGRHRLQHQRRRLLGAHRRHRLHHGQRQRSFVAALRLN
jgi:hypothetical protein